MSLKMFILICLYVGLPSVVTGLIARFGKNRRFVPWFFIGMGIVLVGAMLISLMAFFSPGNPLVGFASIVVLVLGPVQAILVSKQSSVKDETFPCPLCGHLLQRSTAQIGENYCPHCKGTFQAK